jgi:hypothetical protein
VRGLREEVHRRPVGGDRLHPGLEQPLVTPAPVRELSGTGRRSRAAGRG